MISCPLVWGDLKLKKKKQSADSVLVSDATSNGGKSRVWLGPRIFSVEQREVLAEGKSWNRNGSLCV